MLISQNQLMCLIAAQIVDNMATEGFFVSPETTVEQLAIQAFMVY